MNYYKFTENNNLKTVVIDRKEMELLQLNLNKDDKVPTHYIEGVGTAIVLKGKVQFNNENNEEFIANALDIIQFDPNEKHSLYSLEDSIVYVYRQSK